MTTTTTVDLSTKTSSLIEGIRRPFLSFSKDFAGLVHSKAELAPKFMKAFRAWEKETDGTFVAFIRVLDPSVGEDRDDYRAHKTYQAADYLRRLDSRPEPEERTGTSPATHLLGLTRVVATILDLVAEDQQPRLWAALEKELHWTDTQIDRLKAKVGETEPIARLRPPKGTEAYELRVAAA